MSVDHSKEVTEETEGEKESAVSVGLLEKGKDVTG